MLILHAAEAAHDLPLLRGDRLNGEARIFRERHLLEARLKEMALAKYPRLSVQPVTAQEWKIVCALGGVKD